MANFNLDQFKQEALKRDVARPNLFEVLLTPPKSIISSASGIVSLFCDSASLPTQSTITKRLNVYGESYPRVVGMHYGERIALTFILDADMLIRRFFEDWIDLSVNRSSQNVSYQKDTSGNDIYVGGVEVVQLKSKNHDESYRAIFEDAFPVSLQILNLDNNQSNAVHRLDVYFEYRRWSSVMPNVSDQISDSSLLSQQYVADANSESINVAMGFTVVDEFNETI